MAKKEIIAMEILEVLMKRNGFNRWWDRVDIDLQEEIIMDIVKKLK